MISGIQKIKTSAGFTLLEVVLALAVFTLIAAPVIGLLAMTAKGGNRELNTVNAEDLKRRVANELQTISDGFTWDLSGPPIMLYSNRDLDEIESDVALVAEPYFSIAIKDPVDNMFDSAKDYYRLLLLDVRWPIDASGGESTIEQSQLILPVVVTRKE